MRLDLRSNCLYSVGYGAPCGVRREPERLSTLTHDLGVVFCRWCCADPGQPGSLQLSRLTPPFALVREQPLVTAQAGSTSPDSAAPMRDAESARRERARVRKEMRRLRRSLEAEKRAAGERALWRRIMGLGVYRQARSLAVYYAFDGEPSIAHVAEAAARHGKRVYAPVVVGERMHFAPVRPDGLLRRNLFGIEEPALDERIDPRKLDLVLTPLVAFDLHGVRLGVGRGYFDRAFSFLRHRKSWTRPKLLGVAWSFQRAERLEAQPWDIPLWGVVTEAAFHRFAGGGDAAETNR